MISLQDLISGFMQVEHKIMKKQNKNKTELSLALEIAWNAEDNSKFKNLEPLLCRPNPVLLQECNDFFLKIVSLLIIRNKRLPDHWRTFTLNFQSIPCTDNILILN